MTEFFTPEILLQYIYQETEEALNVQIREALNKNATLRQTYNDLLAGIEILDSANVNSIVAARSKIAIER
ncbi:MAG: hypothetical protein IPK18_02765 [Sphingobacteriales bacterium]|jgi:hypothetical protein|nr:MAG: hypothetical protein IPK18_02765 [Sphingobacteriales bacterium]